MFHNNDGSQQEKHEVFVGNLAFNTTDEQLSEVFSEVGRITQVRMVTDQDTGKPRGFAFIEFQDPQAALSAIRNMNDSELNGRKIRVNFKNSSHLEALAGKLGMDVPSSQSQQKQDPVGVGTVAVAEALKGMAKGELYDVVQKLKEIADRDPEEARRILSGHPQLQEAMLFAMSKLDMVKTPVASAAAPAVIAPQQQQQQQQQPPAAADPRKQQRVDPRTAARTDPRARDPRQRAPPAPPPQYKAPHNLDPALVQQVMSLTPHQIAQLPPDKSQSIMALRNQITGGR
jgi:cleavage stimulation factor subunit 2